MDENMLPCSVIAAAGIPSCTTLSSSSSMRQAPSRREYSECRWRWTQLVIEDDQGSGVKSQAPSSKLQPLPTPKSQTNFQIPNQIPNALQLGVCLGIWELIWDLAL